MLSPIGTYLTEEVLRGFLCGGGWGTLGRKGARRIILIPSIGQRKEKALLSQLSGKSLNEGKTRHLEGWERNVSVNGNLLREKCLLGSR